MISITDALMPVGLLISAVSFLAPESVANFSRARWLSADISTRRWRRVFTSFVMKPWYPTFVRFYGLAGLVLLLIYVVFLRHSN